MERNRHGAALDRVLELVVLLSDDMTRSLASDGLTSARAHLLWVLQQDGPSTQRVLADALNVSARNITGLVDALASTGFVTREPHPTDRRATLVSFTPHGKTITVGMDEGHRELADILFGTMPATRFDCFESGLDEILDRLRERLTDENGEAQHV